MSQINPQIEFISVKEKPAFQGLGKDKAYERNRNFLINKTKKGGVNFLDIMKFIL